MLKRLLLALVALVVLAAGAAGAFLYHAHRAVARETAPLPAAEAIGAVAAVAAIVGDVPTRLSVVNTASQAMPRSAVLDPERDPNGAAPYVMSHPAFVLQWQDGRMLMIDAGMGREAAEAFGGPIEWMAGAEPVVAHGSAAEALGDAAAQLKAIVFTHLHTDHVQGIAELCRRTNAVRVPMTAAQAERPNYTTQPGLDLLEDADCVRFERVEEGDGARLFPVDGFPGVFLIDAGGHTPGSQIVLAFVRGDDHVTRRYAFAGDIVNNLDGIVHDVPKPYLYRTVIVPESEPRQHELRLFLKRLQEDGFTVLVSHDQHAIEASGVAAWGG